MSSVPWMESITLTNANQAYNLHTLLSASDSSLPRAAQAINIEADVLATPGALFKIGDKKHSVSLTSHGVQLYAGWSFGMDSMGSNLIMLSDIYVSCDSAGEVLHVTVVTR